jgi:hypothetical protein
MTNGQGNGAFPKRKTPRFRTGPSCLAAVGFQRLAAGRVLELKVENPKSNRACALEGLKAMCPANFAEGAGLFVPILF